MKNRIPIAILMLCLLTMWAGCKKTDFQAQQREGSKLLRTGEYIKNNFSFTIFSAALQKTGWMDSLNNPNAQYTVFIPDDNAFKKDSILSAADLDKWSADSLRVLVKQHIIRNKLFYNQIPLALDNLYPNLNGVNMYVSAVSANGQVSLAVNGVTVQKVQSAVVNGVVYDIPLANGVLHVLNRVLRYFPGTVQQFLSGRAECADLTAGLKRFGLLDSLGKNGPFTVYAPVNAAFDLNNISLDSIGRMDTAKLQSVLFAGYLTYPHHIFITDLSMVYSSALTVSGGYLLSLDNTGVLLQTAQGGRLGPLAGKPAYLDRISKFANGNSTDYLCTNGVVHLLQQLTVLPSDVPKQ